MQFNCSEKFVLLHVASAARNHLRARNKLELPIDRCERAGWLDKWKFSPVATRS
jgi:hypothetical protein